MAGILEVENLSLTIDGKDIYKDVSFCIEKGSFSVLCGRNGAGKSQLLKTIKGLIKPSSGRILIKDQDVSRKKSERLMQTALVFQDADLQSVGESVEKDIDFGPENLGWSHERVVENREKAINLLGLEDLRNQRPSTLSGGEKRKLAIAGVLAMESEIILLDEPFANLDYPSTKTVLETLLNLHAKGMTLLVVTHEVEKFLAHTDKVLILKEGKLIYDGKAEESLEALRSADVYVPALDFKELTWL